jgi:hypothetical protein
MRFEIETRNNLHFAAFIKAHGGTFIEGGNGKFVFESEKSLGEWKVDHTNSCCRRVDRELLELKRFL